MFKVFLYIHTRNFSSTMHSWLSSKRHSLKPQFSCRQRILGPLPLLTAPVTGRLVWVSMIHSPDFFTSSVNQDHEEAQCHGRILHRQGIHPSLLAPGLRLCGLCEFNDVLRVDLRRIEKNEFTLALSARVCQNTVLRLSRCFLAGLVMPALFGVIDLATDCAAQDHILGSRLVRVSFGLDFPPK